MAPGTTTGLTVIAEQRPVEPRGKTLTVAAAQLGGPWLNAEARLNRAIEAIELARSNGAQVVVFPETYLSGYPFWLSRTEGASFNEPDQKACYAYYLDQAIEVGGSEQIELEQAAGDFDVTVVMGISERGRREGRGTVWCSLLTLDPKEGLVGHHRKLVPTYDERLVWGQGDAVGLLTHRVGDARLGSLSCWENWMPQARSALYAQGETVHVSAWPGSEMLTTDIARFIAFEGRVFSIAVSGIVTAADIPDDFPLAERLRANSRSLPFQGGSCVAGPNGQWLIPPITGAEGLVIAELPLADVDAERLTFDPTGHYSRPDVFQTTVHRGTRQATTFSEHADD